MRPRGPQIEIICLTCREKFEVAAWREKNPPLYCNRTCFHNRPLEDVEARFWKKVHKTETCWIFGNGKWYGKLWVRDVGEKVLAHRFSYEMVHGPIPPGMDVCHACDNPPCIRPDHLFLGDAKANAQDALRKGRLATGDRHGTHTQPESQKRGEASWAHNHKHLLARGESHGMSKLTASEVLEIRKLHASGMGRPDIGRRFGVSRAAIGHIVRGLTWTHI